MKKTILSIIAIAVLIPLNAENGYRRFDNAIKRMLMSGMDSSYVCLPSTSWEVPVAVNYSAFDTRLDFGGGSILDLKQDRTLDYGITIGYHGLDLMYTFNNNRKSDNFYIDYFDNSWGIALNIGNYAHNVLDPVNTDLWSHSIMFNAYYAFGGSRYSHPATVYANYIQKRSAGSPLINVWYDYHSYRKGDVELPGFNFDESGHLARIHQGAVTAGYGYNLSFLEGKICLNANAGVGVALPLALAANGSVGGVFWFTDYLRLNFIISNYYQKSWMNKYYRFETNTWRASVGLYYCFGK